MFHVLVLVEKMMGQAWQVRILPEQGGTLCLVIPRRRQSCFRNLS